MRLRHLKIQNFRGIRTLDWKIPGDIMCLVGPGDSTKSTILDAIEYVLYPRWNLTFYDLDFHNADVEKPIEITATVTCLPQKLIREDKFGLHLHFWNYKDDIHDEQMDGDEYALVITLKIGVSLEPEWFVISGQTGEEFKISAADREMMGVSRIGNYLDRDLSWSRGSALSRLTGRDNIDEMPAILADASRNARASVQSANLKHLTDAANRVEKGAAQFGVSPRKNFQPGMDPFSVTVGLGALTLVDDNIPLRSLGLGSRRLVAMSIHKDSSKDGAILLIDEVEQGLEPYRLRSLIRTLRPIEGENRQVFLTTHSNIAIVELIASELHVVRCQNGQITIIPVGTKLQPLVRNIPEAFLVKKIIVCEGKTEDGLCRALDYHWERETGKPFACLGLTPISSPRSGGSAAPGYALDFAKLGYSVAYLGDTDQPFKPDQKELESAGVKVLLWDGEVAIESRLARDLPWSALSQMVALAIDLKAKDDAHEDKEEEVKYKEATDKIWGDIKRYMAEGQNNLQRDLDCLADLYSEQVVRDNLGMAAREGEWFKRIDWGIELGKLVSENLIHMQGKDTFNKIEDLRNWCYA